MQPRNYRIGVGPALELDIAETGAPDGHPLIMIPGLSDSWPSYLPLMRELPHGLRLIAVSLRGHGNSSKTPPGFSLSDMAGDILGVMDGLGIARADVVGHSLGSMVAQKLVELAPHRVLRLALIGPFVRMANNAAVAGFHDDAVIHLTDPVDQTFVRDFQESAVSPATPRETLERAIADSMKLTASDWKSTLGAAMAADLTHALDSFTGPVLVLFGQRDGYCLADEQDELARGAGRRLVSLPHWGHSPHWECPREAAAVIAEFLAAEAEAVQAA